MAPRSWLKSLTRRRFFDDDFDWSSYTGTYTRQLTRIARDTDLWIAGEARYDRATGKLDAGSARLHPNSRAIYEIVGALAVASVHEVGCGAGYHLHNLARIYPDLRISGGDRSTGQIGLLNQRSTDIADRVIVQDITMPMSQSWPRADLVYTQAVLMHIQTAVSHLVALANIVNLADRYVILMENYGRHAFVDDVRRLADGGHLNWPDVNYHYYPLDGRPYCLVLARGACDLPRLTDYASLIRR